MTRTVALCFEYDGSAFIGSQWQPQGRSVQGELETAWQRLTGESNRWIFAGRTDAGVHALAQVAHIRTQTTRDLNTIVRAMQSLTANDVSIHQAWHMPEAFHARFSARQRQYRYLLDVSPVQSAVMYGKVVHIEYKLDIVAMNQALAMLLGTHDFAAFTGAGHEGTTVRECTLAQIEPMELFGRTVQAIRLHANAFLKHMVRNIVGTVLQVGAGRLSLAQWQAIFASCDRRLAGATAPAHGLYLEAISYDPSVIPLDISSRWDGKKYFRTI